MDMVIRPFARICLGRYRLPGVSLKLNVPALGLLLVLLGSVGCAPDRESTSEKRGSVSPKVAQFIIRADKALTRGDYNVTLAMADSAEKYAPELADVHFLRARALSKFRRFDKAQTAYEKVLSLDSSYEGARLNLANNAFRQGRYRKALKLYQEELEYHVAADVLAKMGYTYKALGKADSALWAYQQALAIDSSQASVSAEISQSYEEKGETRLALRHARQAVKLDPNNLDYRYLVGSYLLKAGRTRRAITELETVVKQRPYHLGAQYNLGQALAKLGRESEAQRYLNRVDSLRKMRHELRSVKVQVSQHPDQPTLWSQLGGMQLQNGRLDEAIESLKIALSLDPESKRLQANLATLLVHKGDTKEAIRRYRAVLQQDPTLAEVWLNLGVAYASAGNKAAARKAWKKTLKYKPNNPAAKKYLATL